MACAQKVRCFLRSRDRGSEDVVVFPEIFNDGFFYYKGGRRRDVSPRHIASVSLLPKLWIMTNYYAVRYITLSVIANDAGR